MKQKWALSWNHKCLHFLGSSITIKSRLDLANFDIVIQPQVINKCICSRGWGGKYYINFNCYCSEGSTI